MGEFAVRYTTAKAIAIKFTPSELISEMVRKELNAI